MAHQRGTEQVPLSLDALSPLLDVGLSYLTLDRAGASLSTGERQRIELTSTVRANTTGMRRAA